MDKLITGLIAVFGVVMASLFGYIFCVYLPMNIRAEAKCLERGYPEHRVTWNLDTYCLNLDGTITVKVEKN